jgi:hypothetical protein
MHASEAREAVSVHTEDELHRPEPNAGSEGPNPLWSRLATRIPASPGGSILGEAGEREADRAADGVARDGGAPRDGAPPSSGRRLDPGTRGFMESRLGHEFGDVRIQTNARAARALNARAYAVGSDVVFDEGQYAPALLAHELTHVVQQRSARQAAVQRQVYGPAATTGAGTDFDNFLLQFAALEQAAITDGYGFDDRITAFRKLYYDSASAAKTYAGAVVGGGAFNILIPGAAGTKLPPSWSSTMLGSADYLRQHQVLPIGGKSVDIGHMLAGADAAKHPTRLSLAGGLVKLRSNVEASTFVGDLGSVVTEYVHGSTASFRDTAMVRSPVLDSYYDGPKGMASAEDMAGDADAYSLTFNSSMSLTDNLKSYYAATTGGAKKRFTGFAAAIGLGKLTGGKFTGDTKTWRNAMQEEVFNAALAYAAGKGWKGDVVLVFKDPGPGILTPTYWEMYWNISEWVVDIFVDRMQKDVAKE